MPDEPLSAPRETTETRRSGRGPLAVVVADVNGYQRAGYEAENEAPGAPFQPDPDGVTEEDDHHGYEDDDQDEGMGTEAFHRSAPSPIGVHKSGV
jgi:hypothetical protein